VPVVIERGLLRPAGDAAGDQGIAGDSA
jgi:hypothetical protein